MNDKKTFKVDKEENIILFIQRNISSLSKNNIKSAINRGQILVNNKVIKLPFIVKKDDILLYDKDRKPIFKTPLKMSLEVIFEDDIFFSSGKTRKAFNSSK